MTGNPNAAEAMACAGPNFIVIDMEHTDAPLPKVSAMRRNFAQYWAIVPHRPANFAEFGVPPKAL